MQPDFDCVIVGAGLVGTALAVALSRAGIDVAVVERRPPLRSEVANEDVRGLVLNTASQRILENIGLWDRLIGHVTRINHVHISDRHGFGAVRLDAREVGLAVLGWACPADVLRRKLAEAAQEELGSRLFWSTSFHSCVVSENSVCVRAYNKGKCATFTGRLLVGADGSDSVVRSALDIEVDTFDFGQTAIVANLEVSDPQVGIAYERFSVQGPMAMIPLGGDRYVSVQCLDRSTAEEALKKEDGAYCKMLQRRFGDHLGHITKLGVRRGHEVRRVRAKRIDGIRAILVGNAANTIHPNAAQGLNLGLRDVSTFVGTVAKTSDLGANAVTEGYASARNFDHCRTVNFTDLLAQTFGSRLCLLSAARRATMALIEAIPLFKRRLILEATGLSALGRDK